MRRFTSWERATTAFLASLEIGREALTIKNVRNRIKHLTDRFDFEDVRKITARSYSTWLDGLKSRFEPSTTKAIHSDATRFLKWMRHPHAEDISLIRLKAPEKAIPYYTEAQLSKLIGWALEPKTDPVHRRLSVYVAIVATSGMRPSECCALVWSNWNPDDGTFRLLETKMRVARWAKVHPAIIPLIESWREDISGPWVIPNLQLPEMPLDNPNTIQAGLRRLGVRLGIEGINSKRFRSTVVKRVIEAGGSYEDAAAVVGHATISTTVKHYHRIQLGQRARDAHMAAFETMKLGGNDT